MPLASATLGQRLTKQVKRSRLEPTAEFKRLFFDANTYKHFILVEQDTLASSFSGLAVMISV